MDTATYTIGEFARLTGLTEKALRIYDARGLLPPDDVDGMTGYRRYSASQVDDGRLIAMLRAIDMPLANIDIVLASPIAERSAVVGRYWYEVERRLDDTRVTVRKLQKVSEEREHGMSHAETAVTSGRERGAFAAIASLAGIKDLTEASNAYTEAMRTAYWTDKDIPMATAIAHAGVSRLLVAAESADRDGAYELRSSAKGLMYDLASFTWVGWDAPGVVIGPTDASAGLAAARSNLAMAIELDKGDLAVSRAHWMLGAHLLTSGQVGDAQAAFAESARCAEAAGAEAEVLLSRAFGLLGSLAAGDEGAAERLDAAIASLGSVEDGDFFASQVTTARIVLGV